MLKPKGKVWRDTKTNGKKRDNHLIIDTLERNQIIGKWDKCRVEGKVIKRDELCFRVIE